mgnify:CR=1 FL=1
MKQEKRFDISRWLIFIILIAELLTFALLESRFMSISNIFSMLRQVSMIGISAVGMAMVLMIGQIDISVGPIVALTTVILAKLTVDGGVHTPVAMLIAVAVCTCCGLINGFAVTRFNVPSMIASLALMSILKGLAYLITGGIPIYNIPQTLTFIGQGYLFGILPVPVLMMLIVFGLGYVVVEKTKFGRHILATGGNSEAARLSGIRTKRVTMIVFCISSFLTSIAGIIMCGRVNSGQPSVASGFEMDVIPAVVLGGVSLAGGEGYITNVLAGVLIMGALANGMSVLGLGDYWQWVVKGIVLLIAVSYDNIVKGTAVGFKRHKKEG